MKKSLIAVSALALLAGAGSFAAAPQAFAQAAPPAPPQAAPAMPHRHDRSASRHIEGRIAYMKAELKITPQQEAAWNQVAQAMRDNARDTDALVAQFRSQHQPGQKPNAVQRLEAQGRFASLKVQQNDRLLTALRPLYANLSPDQQQAADHMLGGHRHHRKI